MGKEFSLPWEEYKEVITHNNPEKYIIKGQVDHKASTVSFMTGIGEIFTLPLSVFEPSGNGVCPNFKRPKIIDYGQAVAFGKYEAATDAIFEDYERIKNGNS